MPDFLNIKLVVGLGNPGSEYELTRHNLGFLVVKRIAKELGVKFKKCSFTKAMIAKYEEEYRKIILLMPFTFMNNSGIAVKKAVEHKEISLDDMLLICDDSNLPFGQIRVRAKGSDGGHNGLSSVISHLASSDFPRLRMGIDSPTGKKDLAEYVLEEFNKKEQDVLNDFIEEALNCSLLWIKSDVNQVMENYNRRKENGKK